VFLLSCVICRFTLANQTYIWRPGVGIILDFLESNRFSSSALFFYSFLLLHLCLQDLERLCSVEWRLLFISWSWHCFHKIYLAYFLSCRPIYYISVYQPMSWLLCLSALLFIVTVAACVAEEAVNL